jgi:hypothetical protein
MSVLQEAFFDILESEAIDAVGGSNPPSRTQSLNRQQMEEKK